MQAKKSSPRSFIVIIMSMLKLFQPKLWGSSTALMGVLGDEKGSWFRREEGGSERECEVNR